MGKSDGWGVSKEEEEKGHEEMRRKQGRMGEQVILRRRNRLRTGQDQDRGGQGRIIGYGRNNIFPQER
jgi:hypothetical protein